VTQPLAGYPVRLGTRCGVPGVRLDPPVVGTPPIADRLASGLLWAAWARAGFSAFFWWSV